MRDPTESIAPPGEDDDMDPLSSSQAPLGTRDPGRSAQTRIESPAARNRTPQPPEPSTPDPKTRSNRASKPPPRASSSERPEERIGMVLGSYRLAELLGKGGMGFVYRAEHVKLGRSVALKLLRADYAKRRDSVARFFQEARTVNRVRHRNIVDVTDFVELDDGTTFIIMELLEGESLGKWAKRGFSMPRALALLVQICDGLAAAHAVGVIHRDLKPDNVVVVPTGDGAEIVKLLDFGVAKLLNRDDEDIGLETQAGSVIGTPAYMSPEQAGGTTVDARSDIYSLGAIMYELFCGQPMFKGRSFGEFVRKHLNETPVPPRKTPGGAGLDERIEAVILRCLEKEPARRYPSLGELRDELLHLLGGIETAVGNVRALGDTDSLRSDDLMPMTSRRSSRRSARESGPYAESMRQSNRQAPVAVVDEPRPRRWSWLVAGLVVAGATVAAIVIATSGSAPAPSKQPPAPPKTEPEPKPEITPLATPAQPKPSASTISVTIHSVPEGDVYEVGSATRRCRTPCSVTIDPADGGSTSHRDYIVRASGYHDGAVTIDLASPPRSIDVDLERRESTLVKDAAKVEHRPAVETRPEPEAKPEPVVTEPEPEPEPASEPAPEEKGKDKPKGKDGKIPKSKTKDPFGSR